MKNINMGKILKKNNSKKNKINQTYSKKNIEGDIVFFEVNKTYKDKVAFTDLNCTFKEGEITSLCGLSGSGKTTMLKSILRLLEINKGDLTIGGENIQRWPLRRIRRAFGYIVQSVGLYPGLTLRENLYLVWDVEKRIVSRQYLVNLSNREEFVSREKIDPAAVLKNLHKFSFYKGLAMERRNRRKEFEKRILEVLGLLGLGIEMLEKFPRELSGGQKQRFGISRALLSNSSYILLDEPFSSLDPLTRKDLQELLVKLKIEDSKTIVLVTHNPKEAMKISDKIIALDHGKIVYDDIPSNIGKSQNDFVRAFFEID